MLEDAVDDTADTERWLDDVRHELLLLSVLGLSGEADHLLRENEVFTLLRRDSNCLA